ncbi:MAG TPA: hypothetical protein VHS33_02530 [Sphingomicrobium sp.]|jgi:hypothetical protein|nr:hypothetical protein [Sphingomicrobium sp.]
MTDELQKCSARGCQKPAAVVVAGQPYCAAHALEREQKLPERRRSPDLVTWH